MHPVENSPPKLVQRDCGGWLALSNRACSLKIGVTGNSAEEAEARYQSAVMEWRAILAAGQLH